MNELASETGTKRSQSRRRAFTTRCMAATRARDAHGRPSHVATGQTCKLEMPNAQYERRGTAPGAALMRIRLSVVAIAFFGLSLGRALNAGCRHLNYPASYVIDRHPARVASIGSSESSSVCVEREARRFRVRSNRGS